MCLKKLMLTEHKYIVQIPVAFPVAELNSNPSSNDYLFPHDWVDPCS